MKNAFFLSLILHCGLLCLAYFFLREVRTEVPVNAGDIFVVAKKRTSAGPKNEKQVTRGAADSAKSDFPSAATNTGSHQGSEVRAHYPELSRRLGEEGEVTLQLQIDNTGKVQSVQIKRSSGFVRLDQAARTAVTETIFSGRDREKQITIVFRLKD